MTSRVTYRWPTRSRMIFSTARGKIQFVNTDRRCDLSDVFLLNTDAKQVTSYLDMTVKADGVWDEERVSAVEDLLRYQFQFEGYRIGIRRLSRVGRKLQPSSEPFRWRLVMRNPFS